MHDKKTNRLAHEKSPYLLQHAHNPVDWYPWGEEAFGAAKQRDVPIFLSIGYSTCHWCHVMAHESFEDEEVADALNEAFVCMIVRPFIYVQHSMPHMRAPETVIASTRGYECWCRIPF